MKRTAIVAAILFLVLTAPASAKKDDDQNNSSSKHKTTTTTVTETQKDTPPGQSNKSKTNENPGQSSDSGNSNSAAKTELKDKDSQEIDTETPLSYIVRFVAGVKPNEIGKKMIDDYNDEVKQFNSAAKSALKKAKARGVYKTAFEKVINAAVIEVPTDAVSGLLRNPKVLAIELDAEVSIDPISVSQINAPWGLDRIDQRSLPLSGEFRSPSSASNVSIYIVDTGIDASHPDFTARVASGFDAISGSDGRTDCNSHGTHVAGIAAGATYGVAKSARLVPVRVLGCDGSGSYSGVIAGLEWIATTRLSTERAVANMSLGGGPSASLDAAVASLVSSGVTMVVAAGNSNADACNYSPARAESAITVGATTSSDSRASYSNFGPCLDIYAPGSSITSTIPGGTAIYSGTSMAAPHVTGISAVILSLNEMSPAALSLHLQQNATVGAVVDAGIGSPNLLSFLPDAPTPPDPVATRPDQPNAPIAESRNKAAVISWALPRDGGAPIAQQTIRTYLNGKMIASLFVDGSITTTRVTRLRNGIEYTFTVQAKNSVGSSLESAPSQPVKPQR